MTLTSNPMLSVSICVCVGERERERERLYMIRSSWLLVAWEEKISQDEHVGKRK